MSLPIYKKIKNKMIEEIASLRVNDAIPGERVLAETYGASRMTVRKALDELVDEGYLYRDPKRGTFVADKDSVRKNTLLDIFVSEELDYKVLYFDVKSSSSFSVQKALNISESDQVVRMVRLALVEKEAYAVEEIYVERRKLTDEEVSRMTQWRVFNKFLTKDNVVTQRFVPSVVPVQYARLLKVPLSKPVLIVENFISNRQGEKVAYVKIYHNPEKGHVEITA
ncbi:MAG: GntR family transcriptional regulator [Erysipelothrix sp.]|nr:GntR family transcriptional regulator [Erysipelothrix sp.]